MPFLIRPTPARGESLSSWRQRSGQANGFFWFPTANTPKTGDPDLLPVQSEVGWLSSEFCVSEAILNSMCLNQFSQRSVGEPVGSQFIRWVLSHKGGYAVSKVAGSGYCPECLQTDETPYFRLAWRLAFITHCPDHHCRLLTHCPECGRSGWPGVYSDRHQFGWRWTDMRHCPDCRQDLGRAPLEFDGKHQASESLYGLLNGKKERVVESIALPEDYFRALWSTCRLISRKIDQFCRTGSLKSLEDARSLHSKGWTIEKQSSEVRQAIISNAMWLLDQWPGRFIETCETAGISRTDFGGPHSCGPPWFDEVVRLRLAKAVNWVTREDVSAAVTELKASGLSVSKNALRRHLRITESWAINEILDQRREATCDELAELCRRYRYLIEHTPPSRDQQRTLCRDFLMLLCTSISGQRIEMVCRMTKGEIDQLYQEAGRIGNGNGDLATILDTLSELFNQYKLGIRSVFASRSTESVQYWFLSRFGKPMDGHSVRERFAQLMKVVFEPKLWNSMDVFLNTLADHLHGA